MNEIESMAKKALKDEKLLTELLEGIYSKKCEIRFKKSFKVLLFISEKHPEVLYPQMGLPCRFNR